MGMGDIHMLYWIYLQSSYSYLEIGACIYPSRSGLLISYLNIRPGGNLLDLDSCVLVIPVRIDQSYADRYLVWSISTPPFKLSPFPFQIYVVCVLSTAKLL